MNGFGFRAPVTFVSSTLVASALLSGFCVAGGCKSNNIASTTNDGTTIGAAGGIVAGPDNAELRIPAGALTADTKFTIAVAEPLDYPSLSSTYNFDGKVYAFLPHGTKFLTSVVVSLPHTDGTANVVGLRAEPNGTWNEAPSTTTADAVEISTSSLSFYAVASKAGGGDGGGTTCSGRGPDNSAPTATTPGPLSGTIPNPAVDLSTLVDGYATLSGPRLQLTFTPYQKACGYYANGVAKIGAYYAVILVQSQSGTVTTQTYGSNQIGASSQGLPSNSTAGACSLPGNGGVLGSTGTGVTITALDASHVQGSFDFTPSGGTRLTGTFDLPICTQHPGLNPSSCCL